MRKKAASQRSPIHAILTDADQFSGDRRTYATHRFRAAINFTLELLVDWIRLVLNLVRSRAASSAEILFLRKQLAFYQEHQIRPRRLTEGPRVSLAFWSQWFNWRESLVIVTPETLIRWHRKGFRLFWRRKSRMGRTRLRADIRQLIVRMVKENPTWGQERIAAELGLKLGVEMSPRTVRLLASRVRSEKWEEDQFTALADIYTESCSINPSL